MSKKPVILTVVVMAALAYLAFPYVCLYQISNAMVDRDTAALSDDIDWPAVRQGLKDDIGAAMIEALREKSSDNEAYAMLGSAFGGVIVNAMVDQMASPSMLVRVIDTNRVQTGRPINPLSRVTSAFFNGPASFRVVLVNDRNESMRLEMRLKDWRWKPARLVFSERQLASLSSDLRGRM